MTIAELVGEYTYTLRNFYMYLPFKQLSILMNRMELEQITPRRIEIIPFYADGKNDEEYALEELAFYLQCIDNFNAADQAAFIKNTRAGICGKDCNNPLTKPALETFMDRYQATLFPLCKRGDHESYMKHLFHYRDLLSRQLMGEMFRDLHKYIAPFYEPPTLEDAPLDTFLFKVCTVE